MAMPRSSDGHLMRKDKRVANQFIANGKYKQEVSLNCKFTFGFEDYSLYL